MIAGFLSRLRRAGPPAGPLPGGLPVLRIGTLRRSDLALPLAAAAVMEMRRPHVLLPDVGKVRRADDTTGGTAALLAAFAPVWTGGPVSALVAAARADGADTAILIGDAPVTGTALSLVAVSASRGLGNRLPRPFGPLHARLKPMLAAADGVVLIGVPKARAVARTQWAGQADVLEAELRPLRTGMVWDGVRIIAFASGEAPESLFAALRGEGAEPVREIVIDGDRPLPRKLLSRLSHEASLTGAQLVTTERDATRLPEGFRRDVLALPLRLKFETGGFQGLLRETGLSGS